MIKLFHCKIVLLLIYLLFQCFIAYSQERQPLTLEDVFENGVLQPQTVANIQWMDGGRYYTTLVQNEETGYTHILRYATTTGTLVDTLVNGTQLVPKGASQALAIDDYTLSPDENQVLLATETEPVYRRSTRATYYLYSLSDSSLQRLPDGDKQSYATFSPDGQRVAFVRDNNLYYVTLADRSITAVTNDGQTNRLIHGSADWVYEEEFGFAQAFYWSPQGNQLAYLTFNESAVKEYDMQVWGGLYPQDYTFKYPKAGEQNSVVGASVYHLDDGKTVAVDVGADADIYLPRVQWASDSVLSLIRMNRLQNQLTLLHANPHTGTTQAVLTETSDTYVDVEFTDELTYLKDGQRFIFTSERTGYKHAYLYQMDGTLIRPITQGNWEMSSLLGVDEERDLLYYLSTEESPLERQLHMINLKGKQKRRLSEEPGTHEVEFSPDLTYYLDTYSSIEQPPVVRLHQAPSGKVVRTLEDNQALQEQLANYTLGTYEFITVPIADTLSLNGYLIKPHDFDSTKQYPLLMYVYGGPGSQLVTNEWMGSREAWFYILAERGYLVACVDNRGTGGRGRDFSHITYGQLGKYEVEDQLASARYLGGLPYVDESRIGIWGWSYGGYMAALSLFLGSDVFQAGIAVAPVTNWRFYDTIYTERYLQTPQLNPEGYDQYSPLTHAGKLEDAFLLVHGTGDDNVHFQNAVALQDALIAANKQFESFYYPNRAHSIAGGRGNTRLHLFRMMTDFLERSL